MSCSSSQLELLLQPCFHFSQHPGAPVLFGHQPTCWAEGWERPGCHQHLPASAVEANMLLLETATLGP